MKARKREVLDKRAIQTNKQHSQATLLGERNVRTAKLVTKGSLALALCAVGVDAVLVYVDTQYAHMRRLCALRQSGPQVLGSKFR